MDRYETHRLAQFAASALALDEDGLRRRAVRPQRSVAKWLVEHAEQLGWREPIPVDGDAFDMPIGRLDRKNWEALRPAAEALRAVAKAPAPRASGLERRLAWLGRTLSLDALDAAILALAARAALQRPLYRLAEAVGCSNAGRGEIGEHALAALLGRPLEEVLERLRPSATLRLLGLIEDRGGNDLAPSRLVLRVARMSAAGDDALRAALLGPAAAGALPWDAFAHLGPARDLAARAVAGALERREAGVNLLLYGPPGTGKTEFARALAEKVGARAAFVGEQGDEGAEPARSDRLAAFAVARVLAGQAGGTLLVVDEADDVFTGVDDGTGDRRRGSKIFMNRLVETTAAPTVWITNHPERLGPAVIRRMALAIRFAEPGRLRRRDVVAGIAARRGFALPEGDLDRLAAVRAAPALIASGLRMAALAGGGGAEAALAVRSVALAMGGEAGAPAVKGDRFDFDPALSSADCDLAALAERVAGSRDPALSFCFHGLPGTGKSAYARHLAARLGIDVVERRASDLLSMWVGETEKGIARAFEEAADRRAMLVLDEADALLRDRAGARAAFEVSQVAEMLSRMEAAEHPFACTTNLMDSLDPATLRRFLFKVEFRPLSAGQARAMFYAALGAEPPAGLDALSGLAPGDFALVARKAGVLGIEDTAGMLELLQAEAEAKPGGKRVRIGF